MAPLEGRKSEKMGWKLEHWVKHFGRTVALNGVNLSLEPGTIYGLVGPNGSGKSTLVKALTGLVRLDEGKLFKDNTQVTISSPLDAYRHNICAAHQEISLVPNLSVIDNLRIAALLKSRLFGLQSGELLEEMLSILDVFSHRIPVQSPVRRLGRGEQQLVEIAKALGARPELLLLDEPTSFLTERDIEYLFEKLLAYKASSTILFISHRLKEVLEVCDKIIILRDGRNVAEFSSKDVNIDDVVEIMAGRSVASFTRLLREPSSLKESGGGFFSARVRSPKVKDVCITMERGEIIGLAGLVGHGQSELLRAIAGLVPSNKVITLQEKKLRIKSPADAIRNGIVYVSGVRADMILPERSVRENVAIIKNGLQMPLAPVRERMERELAQTMKQKLGIVCRSVDEPVRFLSGGNQQKTVIARALAVKPKVLLLDDVLKGIDTVTKTDFYSLLSEIAKDCAIVFFASDVDELLPIATRILVMYEGRVIAKFQGAAMTRENILAAALHGGGE
ncbi:MAG: hypothetical protein DRG83_16480 [Deltaproteobacteria bacterium]|nr:MAG: hypothetical protein DRG83_16480 [Deltaproteobacteria bacterium]